MIQHLFWIQEPAVSTGRNSIITKFSREEMTQHSNWTKNMIFSEHFNNDFDEHSQFAVEKTNTVETQIKSYSSPFASRS